MPQATDGVVTEVKAAKLRAFFAPDEIGWTPYPPLTVAPPGTLVTVYPSAHFYAVVDRLDMTFGPDCWRVSYENPGDGSYTRCVLAVRFTSDGEWVTRAGVSDSRDPEIGHAEALAHAAKCYGVARYLDGQSHVTEAIAGTEGRKGYAIPPKLSQHVLPELYRECGREKARVIRDMLASAIKKATDDGCKSLPDDNAALAEYVRRAGADPDCRIVKPDGIYLSRVENRHAETILAYVSEWIADIAAHRPLALSAPIPPTKNPGEKKDEKKSAPETPANKGATTTPGK